MNKFLKYLLIVTLLTGSCAPTPKKASEYNNKLIRQQRKVVDKMDDLIASFSTYNTDEMKIKYGSLQKTIKEAIDSVQQMPAFDGSTEFRDNTLELLKTYKDVTDNEFKTVLALLSKPESQYTAQDAQKVSDLMLSAKNKISNANDKYKEYQKQFAEKYNLTLVEN